MTVMGVVTFNKCKLKTWNKKFKTVFNLNYGIFNWKFNSNQIVGGQPTLDYGHTFDPSFRALLLPTERLMYGDKISIS